MKTINFKLIIIDVYDKTIYIFITISKQFKLLAMLGVKSCPERYF